ncbi:hypothetical protein [Marinithermofilum abyssi]|nr:hypothetical protein [Marinithermofilum abyssi]
MACNHKNLIRNGGFQHTLSPWKGSRARLVPNPIVAGDTSVSMSAGSRLFQVRKGTFQTECAYYLYFRVFNKSAAGVQAEMVASVAYLDAAGRLQRSTPLLVEPPHKSSPSFSSYFAIVPPPEPTTRFLATIFLVSKGSVLIDFVKVAAHEIERQN